MAIRGVYSKAEEEIIAKFQKNSNEQIGWVKEVFGEPITLEQLLWNPWKHGVRLQITGIPSGEMKDMPGIPDGAALLLSHFMSIVCLLGDLSHSYVFPLRPVY